MKYSRMNEQHTTDEQAGGHMDFQRGKMIPRHYSVTMYNKWCLSGSSLFEKATSVLLFLFKIKKKKIAKYSPC